MKIIIIYIWDYIDFRLQQIFGHDVNQTPAVRPI